MQTLTTQLQVSYTGYVNRYKLGHPWCKTRRWHPANTWAMVAMIGNTYCIFWHSTYWKCKLLVFVMKSIYKNRLRKFKMGTWEWQHKIWKIKTQKRQTDQLQPRVYRLDYFCGIQMRGAGAHALRWGLQTGKPIANKLQAKTPTGLPV